MGDADAGFAYGEMLAYMNLVCQHVDDNDLCEPTGIVCTVDSVTANTAKVKLEVPPLDAESHILYLQFETKGLRCSTLVGGQWQRTVAKRAFIEITQQYAARISDSERLGELVT